jgi:hypothetical protein
MASAQQGDALNGNIQVIKNIAITFWRVARFGNASCSCPQKVWGRTWSRPIWKSLPHPLVSVFRYSAFWSNKTPIVVMFSPEWEVLKDTGPIPSVGRLLIAFYRMCCRV